MIWLIAIVLCAVFLPSLWVRWVMRRYAGNLPDLPGTGGELAKHLIQRFDLDGVKAEVSDIGDHYDPQDRMVRLSEANWSGRLHRGSCCGSRGGSCHSASEQRCTFAGQNRPRAMGERFGQASVGVLAIAPVIGLLTRHPVPPMLIAVIGLSGLVLRMLLHLVTLPTEWDASFGKALPILRQGGYISTRQEAPVRRVLRAAALTYFAAALADAFNLFRWASLLLRR